MSEQQQADFLYRAIERFADWVKFADTKAGAVLVILAIGSADLISNANRLADAHKLNNIGVAASITFWIAAALAAVTVAFVALTLFPRVAPRSGASLFFFGSVASYRAVQDYRVEVAKMDDEDLVRQLSAQAWELARIANAKVGFVQIASATVLGFIAAWAVARFLLRVA